MISHLPTMDKELNQLFQILQGNAKDSSSSSFGAADSSSSTDNNNAESTTGFTNQNMSAISLNQLICYDFMLYTSIDLICNPLNKLNKQARFQESIDADQGEDQARSAIITTVKPRSRQVTQKSHEILWHNLIQTTFICLKNQSSIDNLSSNNLKLVNNNKNNNIKNNSNSAVKSASTIANKSQLNLETLTTKSELLFKTVYSNTDADAEGLNDENMNSLFSFEVNNNGATETIKKLNDNRQQNAPNRKSSILDLLSVNTQRALVLKNLFFFLNDRIIFSNNKNCCDNLSIMNKIVMNDHVALGKSELMDLLATSIDRY
jgi:hypothetical protein